MEALAGCVGNRWSPQIGDPTVAGWGTVFAYFVYMALSLLTMSQATDNRERLFWGMISPF